MTLKKTTYEVLGVTPGNRISRIVDIFLISLISLNAVALIMSTVEEAYDASPQAFWIFETFTISVFTVEYLLRVWSCTADPKYSHPVKGRLRYIVSPVALIDLLAIVPFYATLLLPLKGLDFRILRAVRLIARVARLSRYSTGAQALDRVIQTRRSELFTVVVVLTVLLLLASSLMYFAEKDAQPEKFANIPQAMWWSIITLTTVGYGDVFPITNAGRILAGLMAIVGVGLFALPAAILGAGFVDELSRNRDVPTVCPHCNREIHS